MRTTELARVQWILRTVFPQAEASGVTLAELVWLLPKRRPKRIVACLDQAIAMGMMRKEPDSKTGFRYYPYQSFFRLYQDQDGIIYYYERFTIRTAIIRNKIVAGLKKGGPSET